MAEWKICTLGDLGQVIGGATPSTKDESNYNGDIPWITPKDLSNFSERYISKGERNITQKGLYSCSTQVLPKNSVLFSSRAPIGYVAIAKNELCTNQGFKSIISNSQTHYLFLYYLLKYNKNNIENMGSGTTFKEVSGSTMRNIEVCVPVDYRVQKRIADILGSIDDKIEKNNAINNNLEQQLQATYKSWFVDFEPFNGYMPESWVVTTFGEVCHNLRERILCNDYTVFSAVSTGELQPSEEFFTKQVFSKDISNYLKVPQKAFAYNPARINIGSIGLNTFNYDGCVSPVYVVFTVDKDYEAFFNYTIKTLNFKEEVKTRASGSVRQSLNYKDLALIELIYPDEQTAKKFNDLFWFIHESKTKINNETQSLIELRDTLLPRLMSGELDVSDIDI